MPARDKDPDPSPGSLVESVSASPSVPGRRPRKTQIGVNIARPAPPAAAPSPTGKKVAIAGEATTKISAPKAMPRKAWTKTSAMESEATAVESPCASYAATMTCDSGPECHGVSRN